MKNSSADASAQKQKSPEDTKIQVLDAVEDVFLGKACFTIVGFCLKEAICGTLKGTGVEEETGEVENKLNVGLVPHAITTHLLLVGFAVGLRQILDRRESALTITKHRHATFVAFKNGLDLIPAWSFKGLVATVTAGESGVVCALAVLIIATVLAVVLTPEEMPAGEPEGIVHSLRRVLATSMGLGVGFAVNSVPQHLWRDFADETWGPWFQIPVMVVYPFAVTAAVVPMQVALGTFIAGGGHGHFVITFVNFVKVAGNFVVAWAFDGLLNTLRLAVLDLHPHTCLTKSLVNLLWAFMIVLMAVGVVFLLALTRGASTDESEMRKTTESLALLASGVIVAWGFLDFIVGLYQCIPLQGNWQIAGAWLFAGLVTMLAAFTVESGTFLSEKIKST